MYRKLLFVHRWSGIVAAAVLIVAGLTGSAITFRAEIERALNADTLRVVPRGAARDADALAARVASRHPDAWIGGVVPGADPRDAWIFTLSKPGARAGSYSPSTLHVDPYSGEIVGTRTRGEFGLDRQRIMGVLFELHHDLMLGLAGHWILAVSGIVWILLSLVGVYLALKQAGGPLKALRVTTGRGTLRLLVDLHRSLGLATLVAVLAIALSGIHLSVRQEFAAVVGLFSRIAPNPERGLPDRDDAGLQGVGFARAIAVAQESLPGSRVQSISVLHAKRIYRARVVRAGDVNQRGDHLAYVDMNDGRLVLLRDLMQGSGGDVFLAWQRPLHSGEAFGLAGRIAACVAGLLPAGFAGTGIYVWLKRRRRRRPASELPGNANLVPSRAGR